MTVNEPAGEPDKGSDGTITVGTAARLIMTSEEWVRRLVKMGYVQRAERGKFNLVNVVQGYIKYLKDEDRRSSKSATASRMQEAKATEIDMRIAEKRRELIPLEEATTALEVLAGKIRSEFAGLPARVTRDMSLRRQIESEVNGSLNRAAEQLLALAVALREGGDVTGSPGSDDAG